MGYRIQNRRDTAARWAEMNPILLEGEMGIVLDDPNQYKIGDGVHTWNELPLRGFTGTIAQTLGNNENAVASQKVVTEKFAEQDEKLSDIGSEVKAFQESKDAVFEKKEGYAIIGSNISVNNKYSYTSPIQLKKGEAVIATLICNEANAISLTDENGSFYKALVSGKDSQSFVKYTYIADENCYISICWRSTAHSNLESVKIVSNTINTNLIDFKGELRNVCSFDWEIGSISVNNGMSIPSSSRLRTMDFIDADMPYIINITNEGRVSLRYYDENKVFISASNWFTADLNPMKTVPTACKFVRILLSYSDDRDVSNVAEADSLCKITSYQLVDKMIRMSQGIDENKLIAQEASQTSTENSKAIAALNEGVVVISPTWIEGYYVDWDGALKESSSYQYSEPIRMQRNTEIILKTAGNAFCGISKKVSENVFSKLLFCKNEDKNKVSEYRYVLGEDADVVFCVKRTSDYSVWKNLSNDVKEIIPISMSNVGNISIVAAKEHHYSDGTYPIAEWYLLKEPDTNKFFWSTDLKNKSLAFTFNGHENYSFGILHNGDIIAVRLASSLPLTSSESNRVNPYIFKASENWSVAHEVEFNEKLKPCGWLENCGYVNLPNGETMFCEYTRISVETCNVWKITGDASDANNWSIKKTFTLSGEEDAGLKHLHAVRNDPFTGYVYISTGDYEASSIYVSKDNGETFIPVLENNEALCRSLEITFTRDFAFYGNDSTQHIFVKAPRKNDGVIDLDNAQTITIPKTEGGYLACYGQAYIPEYNVCLVFDRQDGGGTALSFPLYVVDLETLECHSVGIIEGLSNQFGFRTLYSEWYPNNAVIHVGFGFSGKVRNKIKVCGNTMNGSDGTGSVNNLVIRVYKINGMYSMKLSTLYI